MALRILGDPIARRGVLPESIIADPLDLMTYTFEPWELRYDSVSTMKHVEERCLVQRAIYVGEVLRVGRLPHPSDVEELREERRRAHRREVEEAADAFIADRAPWSGRPHDFGFREEVLAEVAARLRELTADPFLRRALERG